MTASSSTSSKEDDILHPQCSADEYKELLQQASSLTINESKIELLECTRYGEIDAVRAILQKSSKKENILNYADANGNTSLHKACANGHAELVKLLIKSGVKHTQNSSGNTPLHWAAANGHLECVKLILNSKELKGSINVLQKNSFGKSALSEGFSSQKTEIVGALLEHDSAEEEKLIGGIPSIKEDDDEKKDGNEKKKRDVGSEGVIHDFDFRLYSDKKEDDSSSKVLKIRELAIKNPDNPFGDEPKDDTTGLGVWCASLVMARWMASFPMNKFNNKTILELGAGCGIPSLSLALYSTPEKIYISDFNPETVDNIQHNINLNKSSMDSSFEILALSMDWQDKNTWPDHKLDVILGSDLIYQQATAPILKYVLLNLLKPKGIFYYVAPKDYLRHGLEQFISSLKLDLKCVAVTEAPAKYKHNPLLSQDDDDLFLHFSELNSLDYLLYEFRLDIKK